LLLDKCWTKVDGLSRTQEEFSDFGYFHSLRRFAVDQSSSCPKSEITPNFACAQRTQLTQ